MKKIIFYLSLFINCNAYADLTEKDAVCKELTDCGFVKISALSYPAVSNPDSCEYKLLKAYMEKLKGEQEPNAKILYDVSCKIREKCCFHQANDIANNLLARSLQKGFVPGAASSLVEMGLLSSVIDQNILERVGINFSDISSILEIMLYALDYKHGYEHTKYLIDEGDEFGNYRYKDAVLSVTANINSIYNNESSSHSHLTLIVESAIAISLTLKALIITPAVVTTSIIQSIMEKIIDETPFFKANTIFVEKSFKDSIIPIVETLYINKL